MRMRLWALTFTAVLAIPTMAFATAPDDQIVNPDPTGQSLYSVVDFFRGINGTTDQGTGSIIGKMVSGNIGYFCVLTADHVISDANPPNFIGVGTRGGNLPPVDQRLPFVTVAVGGATGTEDLVIVMATVGDLTNAAKKAVYDSVVPLQVANPKTRPLQVNDIFTEYGYGNTGTSEPPPAGNPPGYRQQNSDFIKRFQNNKVLGITGNVNSPNDSPRTGNPYVEEQIQWNTVAPSNNLGQGTSFAGDSGGPYLSSYPTSITITRDGKMLTINNVLTDFIVGVHASADPAVNAAVKLNGSMNVGVYIDQLDYDWIEMNLCPEPSSVIMLVLGGLIVLLWCRRRVRLLPSLS